MPRRKRIFKKYVSSDAVYQSPQLSRFINKIMCCGKKNLAERIVYQALEQVTEKHQEKGIDVFFKALKNVTPLMEVKSRRVGGANYQVPIEVHGARGEALASRWIIQAAESRNGKTMTDKLAAELFDASQGIGASIKKREDVHKMAESNKAFAHFRW
jgi:small subunit ribosomal protein S7